MHVVASGLPMPNYGCGPTDFSCLSDELVARMVTEAIGGMGNFIADMLVNAFKDSTISDDSWKVAESSSGSGRRSCPRCSSCS